MNFVIIADVMRKEKSEIYAEFMELVLDRDFRKKLDESDFVSVCHRMKIAPGVLNEIIMEETGMSGDAFMLEISANN